jgi:hypothetical protein
MVKLFRGNQVCIPRFQHRYSGPGTLDAEAGLHTTGLVKVDWVISLVHGFATLPQIKLPPTITDVPEHPFGFETLYANGPDMLFGAPTIWLGYSYVV